MADVYEQNLAQKSTLTTSDYIRVVGADNVSYKQYMKSVADAIRTIVSTQDLNTATKNGEIYQFGTVAENRPADMPYGYVFAMSQDSNGTNCHQLALDRGGTGRGVIYIRSRLASTWGDWIKMPTRAEVDTLNSLIKRVTLSSSSSANVSMPTPSRYGTFIITGFAQSIGAVMIGITINAEVITSVRNLMTGTDFSSSYLTFSYANGVLTISSTNSATSIFTIVCG